MPPRVLRPPRAPLVHMGTQRVIDKLRMRYGREPTDEEVDVYRAKKAAKKAVQEADNYAGAPAATTAPIPPEESAVTPEEESAVTQVEVEVPLSKKAKKAAKKAAEKAAKEAQDAAAADTSAADASAADASAENTSNPAAAVPAATATADASSLLAHAAPAPVKQRKKKRAREAAEPAPQPAPALRSEPLKVVPAPRSGGFSKAIVKSTRTTARIAHAAMEKRGTDESLIPEDDFVSAWDENRTQAEKVLENAVRPPMMADKAWDKLKEELSKCRGETHSRHQCPPPPGPICPTADSHMCSPKCRSLAPEHVVDRRAHAGFLPIGHQEEEEEGGGQSGQSGQSGQGGRRSGACH